MNGWEARRIGDLASVKGGKRLPKGISLTADRNKHPYLRIVDVRDNRFDESNMLYVPEEVFPQISRYTVNEGDIFISIVGTIGLVARVPNILDGASLTENAAKICGFRESILPEFLSLFLRSPSAREQIRALTVGSTQPKLALHRIADIIVPVPSVEEQAAIVSVLGSLERKVDLNRRTNEIVEAMAQAIFRDWFVDFGPVRRKLTGETDPVAIMGGLTGHSAQAARLATIFPAAISSADVPEGWSIKRLGHFFRLERGLSYKGSALTDRGKPLINLGCFSGAGGFNAAKLKFYAGDHKPRHIATPGTLLIANTDITQDRVILGSPHIVEEVRDDQPLFSHHIYAARPLSKTLWERFFFYHLMEPAFRERAAGYATGTTVLALPKDAVEAAEFAIPPEPVLDAFLDIIGPLLDRARVASAENRTLAETRDYLLPRLMSGAVRVGNINPQEAAA